MPKRFWFQRLKVFSRPVQQQLSYDSQYVTTLLKVYYKRTAVYLHASVKLQFPFISVQTNNICSD